MTNHAQLEAQLQLTILPDTNLPAVGAGYLNEISKNTNTAILINISDTNNPLTRLIYLVKAKLQIAQYRKLFKKNGFKIIATYGVYPCKENPVAVVALDSPAEKYANARIFPIFQNDFNGILRKFIMKIIKFHPSLGCIILVFRKQ